MQFFYGILVFTFFLLPQFSKAEPWLSNRYAQNCAGCHAPGRVNRPMEKRRCTLNCQGCHVNPNGGGLRNLYGKWNQEKWLHSFDSEKWKQGHTAPAPYKAQPFYDKTVSKYLASPKASKKAKARLARKLSEEGLETRYLPHGAEIPHEQYTKEHAADEFTVEPSDAKWMMRIPKDDPYRVRRETTILAGGDLRYFMLNQEMNDESETYTFPMGVDFGLRYMPVDKVSFVTEARFLNGPTGQAWEDAVASGQIRSAYLLVDDLSYNSFAMYGLYRPMFGHYSPDHTSLFSRMTGLTQRTVVKGLTLGTAPNVPFFNFHLISPTTNNISKDSGYAMNVGARFVSYGASMMLSYWDTTADVAGTETSKKMTSLNGGATIWDIISNFDFTVIDREVENISKDRGAVMTLETKYRFWRENYLQLNYASANTLSSLQAGTSNQMSYGVKSFLYAGTELEFLMGSMTESPEGAAATTSDYWLMQFHLYY